MSQESARTDSVNPGLAEVPVEISIAGDWSGVCQCGGIAAPLLALTFTASFRSVPFGEMNLFGRMDHPELPTRSPETLIGSHRGSIVRFSRASSGPEANNAMEFVGYISDDGEVMRGCWRSIFDGIASRTQGNWTARRRQTSE